MKIYKPKTKIVQCKICWKDFETCKYHPRLTCSKECHLVLLSQYASGENNPNYQNKSRTADWNRRISEYMKAHWKSQGWAIKGCKKDSTKKLEYFKTHPWPRLWIKHTAETKKLISEISKTRCQDAEYRKRYRKAMEEAGAWIPLSMREPYYVYRDKTSWIENMFDLITDQNQLDLLKQHGAFHTYTNTKWVVRDHMYSRRSWFEYQVFPEIMRHPCNCQIITHRDNLKKRRTRYEDGDSQTLQELFNKIKNYKGTWQEHDIALERIKQYENWERYFVG